jgi:hypothetical protein
LNGVENGPRFSQGTTASLRGITGDKGPLLKTEYAGDLKEWCEQTTVSTQPAVSLPIKLLHYNYIAFAKTGSGQYPQLKAPQKLPTIKHAWVFSQGGTKTRIFAPFENLKRSFYQDRLATNIGKPEKRDAFSYRRVLMLAFPV